MRVLLIHLSDIHVRSDADPILGRAEQIASAVQDLDLNLTAAIVAVSGDLAYSGCESQYLAVWPFLEDLKARLEAKLAAHDRGHRVPVSVVAIPGNHDCDFSSPDSIRPLAVKAVLADPSEAQTADIVEACLKVQAPFFEALRAFGTGGVGTPASEYDSRLLYQYRIPVGDKTVRVVCLNTAWLSQHREEQGKLYLPADAVPTDRVSGEITVVMLHHPYNWMDADTYRPLRRRIEAVADLILTGHEHDGSVRALSVSTGTRNTVLEGGALQTSDPGESDSTLSS